MTISIRTLVACFMTAEILVSTPLVVVVCYTGLSLDCAALAIGAWSQGLLARRVSAYSAVSGLIFVRTELDPFKLDSVAMDMTLSIEHLAC
jgi:hypothetical protein